jgi:hypothetical protein
MIDYNLCIMAREKEEVTIWGFGLNFTNYYLCCNLKSISLYNQSLSIIIYHP